MTEPGVRWGLSDLIPGSSAAIRPRPAKTRHQGPPVLAARPLDHNHPAWKPYAASCPACRQACGPGTAVGLLAQQRGLSVQDCLRYLEQQMRDNDPWNREMNERARQIRARLAETPTKEGMK
jgi:hypothetical protein